MAGLLIEAAAKSFGDIKVLDGVSLALEEGEFCVIVGGSGCGKSTLLRAIAGLEQLDSGTISIGDRRIDQLPPAERGIAMVFQSYALYPHLTVYENLAFALRLSKCPRAEIDEAVARAAGILGLDDDLQRKPAALSGGQRPRVAIGRAIVRQPDIFLFDEPLSNLDAGLRNKMRFEFAALHRQLGTTTVYVTHDQVDRRTLRRQQPRQRPVLECLSVSSPVRPSSPPPGLLYEGVNYFDAGGGQVTPVHEVTV